MTFDPADFWDPKWKRWFAESDERERQRKIALNGRESFDQNQLPAGVDIAIGVVDVPIVLSRIGQPKPTPGTCQCRPPCIPGVPIFSNSQKQSEQPNMVLTETEKAVCRATGVSEEQFAHARNKRSAIVASPAPAKVRAGFIVNAKDMGDDALDHERDLAAGRHSLAAYENATDPATKAEHLSECASAFLAASRKFAHRVTQDRAAHSVLKFAK